MQLIDGSFVISSQDLVSNLECSHKLHLNLGSTLKLIEKPKQEDPALEIIMQLGIEHEKRVLDELSKKKNVVQLDQPTYSITGFQEAWQQTKAAIDSVVDVIYQATVFTEDFVGFIDFLVKATDETGTALRDDLGRVIYEPVDTKSARSAKKNAVIQVAAYCEALVRLNQPSPINARLWLGNDTEWSAPASKLIPLAREVRERTIEFLKTHNDLPEPLWGAPVSACTNCVWKKHCESGRVKDRDLSLVQGIYGVTRRKLLSNEIKTIDDLAKLNPAENPPDISKITFGNLVEQAKIQVKAEVSGQIETEIKNKTILSHLPERCEGDIWFDMEGDPYANSGSGLEYMFGVGYLDADEFAFRTFEGSNSAEEKQAFENFIDYLVGQIAQYPEMHIYHYASYEKTAITKLSVKYATREDEVYRILSEGRLVDLYNVVRGSFRISTPSLSIKDVEHIYRGNRNKDGVTNAMDSVIQYEAYLALVDQENLVEANDVLAGIRNYNRDDCQSTYELDTWIRDQINEQGIPYLGPIKSEFEVEENLSQAIATNLLLDVPINPEERSVTEQAVASMAASVMYHSRESKPFWWNVFELARASKEELEVASDAVAFDQVKAGGWAISGRQTKYRRTVTIECLTTDLRDYFEVGSSVHLLYKQGQLGMFNLTDAPGGFSTGKLLEIRGRGKFAVIEEYEGSEKEKWNVLPIGLTPGRDVNNKPLVNQLAQLGAETLSVLNLGNKEFPEKAWADILLRRKPRQMSNKTLPKLATNHESIREALIESENSYIAVQGPPGTGKTYTGSRVVSELVQDGWRVGVVAQSHAVVEQFMDKVRQKSPYIPMAKKAKGESVLPYHKDKVAEWAELQPGGFLIGGTAWTFVNPKIKDLNLDLIVIDEAGQFSLANTIAVASTTKKVLLLGDPQQLPQVSQGAHPEPVEIAALAHLLDGRSTIPDDFGYFLDKSFRMHSEVTKKVSELQYDGKLKSSASTNNRSLNGVEPGVHRIEVSHLDNRVASEQEANAVKDLIFNLQGKKWNEETGQPSRSLGQSDFIVVAPYNAQVRMIRRTLDANGLDEVQVGTVDKFQGREAVIAIVSMTTSSDENLPRGIDFLLSPNRLNVAISRAQWAAYIVHSPELRRMNPSSIPGLLNLGGFLGILQDT